MMNPDDTASPVKMKKAFKMSGFGAEGISKGFASF
jgi:hypothetical protein